MKVILALAVLATSVTAVAASDSSINDLQYLPNAGTFLGSSSYTHLKYDGGKQNTFTQRVGYSLADNLFVDANVSYSGGDSGSNKGLGDVVLNGRYRLSDSSANRLDLIGGLSISPGDSEVETDNDSNAYSGGHALRVGAEYGNKTSERQWSFGAFYIHQLESTTKYKGGFGKDKEEAHGVLSLSAQLLTKITETSYFKTFGAVDFAQEHDTDSDSGDFENAGATIWRIGGEYQYVCSKDFYVGLGATTYQFGESSSGPIMQYTASANYQF